MVIFKDRKGLLKKGWNPLARFESQELSTADIGEKRDDCFDNLVVKYTLRAITRSRRRNVMLGRDKKRSEWCLLQET